jgi:hypothetical protein
MSGNLSVPIQTQSETSPSPNIIIRLEESTGERKSKHFFQNRNRWSFYLFFGGTRGGKNILRVFLSKKIH